MYYKKQSVLPAKNEASQYYVTFYTLYLHKACVKGGKDSND